MKILRQDIVTAICVSSRLKWADIIAEGRDRDCVIPRQIAAHFFKKELGWKPTKIAKELHRDRSTVPNSLRRVKDMIDVKDPLYMDLINKVDAYLKNHQMQSAFVDHVKEKIFK